MPTTIVIADDHALFRSGLACLLKSNPRFSVVAEAADGEEAVAAVAQHQPDVVLLDVKMPNMDGIEALSAIKLMRPDTAVILLSGFLDPKLAYESVERGAGGYLIKSTDFDTVCNAINAVRLGGTFLPPEVQTELAIAVRGRGEKNLLSDREREILAMVSEGHHAPEIAAELFIEPVTVKSHLRNIYRKLEVADRAQAVKEAMRRGIIG
jgi:DNA-binding NarL/FixJ family response regulator